MTLGVASRPPRGRSPLAVDTMGMWDAATALPEQLAAALARATSQVTAGEVEALVGAGRPELVLVHGAGDGEPAARLVATVAAATSPVPVAASGGFGLPRAAGPGWVVVATSWTGDDEETVVVAEAAGRAGARVVAVTGGGRLGELAAGRGWPVLAVPADGPRAGLGDLAVPALLLLERFGLVGDVAGRVRSAADHLAGRRDRLVAPGSTAEEVARRVGRTVPLVHGAGVAAVAARRWAAQVRRNAKTPAWWSSQPGLAHDEVAGWGQLGDVTRQVHTLVTLRHPGEPPEVARRMAAVEELMLEVVGDVIAVRTEADDDLARCLDLVLCGDLVSLHLAAREGVDPGPLPVLDELGVAP